MCRFDVLGLFVVANAMAQDSYRVVTSRVVTVRSYIRYMLYKMVVTSIEHGRNRV
jgi:hypothetical protein